MSGFTEISPVQFKENPFVVIGREWMLITAENEGKVNTMTASWGGLGVIFGQNAAFIFIRPQRYTKEFVDANDTFSLSILPETYRKVLNYLGTVSGRDEDKVKKSGLTLAYSGSTPYFEEANKVMICKKMFVQEFKKESFINPETCTQFYPGDDFHTLYIASIEKLMIKE